MAATMASVVEAQELPKGMEYHPADYVWTSQSVNSSGSMPCGGGDIGMNVWVEKGDVLVYLSQSGWFDENNTLLKCGRLRLRTEDAATAMEKGFRQTLSLEDGSVRIEGDDIGIRIWADTETPDIFITYESKKEHKVRLTYETWRRGDRKVPKDDSQQCSYKWVVNSEVYTRADSVEASRNKLTFSHKNRRETVFDYTVGREGLESIKGELVDPIGGREMRGELSTGKLTYTGKVGGQKYASTEYTAYNYEGRVKKETIHVRLTTSDHGQVSAAPTEKQSRKRSAEWWKAYWQRSYIVLDKSANNDTAKMVVRAYELCRYMMGCNERGHWPTKFNGGLFTFDPEYVRDDNPFTPDYRRWGGGTMTAQNQRLVYWHTIASGDLGQLRVQLDTYKKMLPNAVRRTRAYWGHGGASFTEQIENFGLPNPAENGKPKNGSDPGVERNAWLEYLWDTSLEFCMMALEADKKFDSFDAKEYEELIWQCLTFFDEHYRYMAKKRGAKETDEAGKIVIYPGSGCETYKMAYNPSSTIAALKRVGEEWKSYLERKEAGEERIRQIEELLSRVPEIPTREIEGKKCIAPALAWMRVQNSETPQMYPVWPWGIYGLGRDDIETAINTWTVDPQAIKMRSSKGWKQDNIWAACLGNKSEAARLTSEKFADGPYRFPAFYPSGFDWAPDHNRAGSAMIGLQKMLLQHDKSGRRIEKPAWPETWGKVYYKLY